MAEQGSPGVFDGGDSRHSGALRRLGGRGRLPEARRDGLAPGHRPGVGKEVEGHRALQALPLRRGRGAVAPLGARSPRAARVAVALAELMGALTSLISGKQDAPVHAAFDA